MAQAVAPLGFKPSRLQGLSERLLASHYENNHGRRSAAAETEVPALRFIDQAVRGRAKPA
ncbi:hypothetical protein AAFN86_11800 [Roseomonas sp. CAU 1739]|uniref:hypothetical protein n=1 Tax=Roseomonas sp. CAU 1739 TaxID=3140364 RepID=UPI00325BFCD2